MIDVSIAAHYVPSRVGFLVEALAAIRTWNESAVAIRIVTNDLRLADEPEVMAVSAELEKRGFTTEYDRAHSMEHPWHLTWWHKKHLREWVTTAGPEDLFIYIEDDIAIGAEALAYFKGFLPAAKAKGLIPGFIRYEVTGSGGRVAIDFRGSQIVEPSQILQLDGQRFIASQFPYWAGFIMDRELCYGYLQSPWSDIEAADTLPQSRKHSCRVQSAWALTYWQVPSGLPSRYVVPVDDRMIPLQCCQVWHAANNYSRTHEHSFGTVQIQKTFKLPSILANVAQWHWRLRALVRRIYAKARRELEMVYQFGLFSREENSRGD